MNIEDKILFEQRFKGVGISEEEFLLFLNCLRHSREINSSADFLLCRFDKKIEINFSLGLNEDNVSKTIGGFISYDGNSVLFFDCEKYNYETGQSIKYNEEFIFETSFIKRITSYSDKKYTEELPLFRQEETQNFIEEKVSQLKSVKGRK